MDGTINRKNRQEVVLKFALGTLVSFVISVSNIFGIIEKIIDTRRKAKWHLITLFKCYWWSINGFFPNLMMETTAKCGKYVEAKLVALVKQRLLILPRQSQPTNEPTIIPTLNSRNRRVFESIWYVVGSRYLVVESKQITTLCSTRYDTHISKPSNDFVQDWFSIPMVENLNLQGER